jgi:hypothetical protein
VNERLQPRVMLLPISETAAYHSDVIAFLKLERRAV